MESAVERGVGVRGCVGIVAGLVVGAGGGRGRRNPTLHSAQSAHSSGTLARSPAVIVFPALVFLV